MQGAKEDDLRSVAVGLGHEEPLDLDGQSLRRRRLHLAAPRGEGRAHPLRHEGGHRAEGANDAGSRLLGVFAHDLLVSRSGVADVDREGVLLERHVRSGLSLGPGLDACKAEPDVHVCGGRALSSHESKAPRSEETPGRRPRETPCPYGRTLAGLRQTRSCINHKEHGLLLHYSTLLSCQRRHLNGRAVADCLPLLKHHPTLRDRRSSRATTWLGSSP